MNLELALVILLVVVLLVLAIIIKELSSIKSKLAFVNQKVTDNSPLQLQAYERLALFAERSSLRNLVTRVDAPTNTAAAMHYALLEELKNEFAHNVSQQIYVKPEVWDCLLYTSPSPRD